jgi:hypothetical protein
MQGHCVRRVVRTYLASALDRQQADLERFVAEHLEYPDSFPLELGQPAVEIREVAHLKIVGQLAGDFPDVDVSVRLPVAVGRLCS